MADIDAFDDGGEEEEGAGAPEGEDEGALILIVVGAHLRAEVGDRPLAYELRDRMVEWMSAKYGGRVGAKKEDEAEDSGLPCEVVVCTDVWFLNDASLRVWPAVSIGGPGVNALSAYLGDKLPSVLVIDDVLMIQMDPDFKELTAAVWGIDHDATVDAVDAFIERYLGEFMKAAMKAWGS